MGTGNLPMATTTEYPTTTALPGGPALVPLEDVPAGGSASARLNGVPVLVSRPADGEVKAFTAICTHMGCTVNPAGAEFHCPCHGSVYDAFTGAVKKGPAPRPLKPVAAAIVANNNIQLG
jgi:Rieske Fe-S protein